MFAISIPSQPTCYKAWKSTPSSAAMRSLTKFNLARAARRVTFTGNAASIWSTERPNSRSSKSVDGGEHVLNVGARPLCIFTERDFATSSVVVPTSIRHNSEHLTAHPHFLPHFQLPCLAHGPALTRGGSTRVVICLRCFKYFCLRSPWK